MTTFRTLDDITPADLPRVGGKAFNCARLKQAGFPVPDAIVVPSDATDDEIRSLADDAWFDGVPAGTLFAVRSSGLGEDSAGHSFAGIHETHLNVPRVQAAEAVLVCRRSAQSAQARAYREARHLENDEARIAVLVQCMVPAVTSGVAFTINPVTGADELVINSVSGLGEALVSGQVTPDELVLPKSDDSPLARLLVAIERHYGAPQDIEWCHDGTQYWIVQSRPVTTGGAKPSPVAPPDAPVAAPAAAKPETEWTRANLAEVLPDQVSPQALEVFVDLLNYGEGKFFGRLTAPVPEAGPIVKVFHGRMYFNLSQLRHVSMIVGAPFAHTMRSLGHPEQIRPEDEIAVPAPLGKRLRALPDLLRLVFKTLRARRVFLRHQAQVDAILAKLAANDPHALSDADLWAMLRWWNAAAKDSIEAVLVMSGVQMLEDVIRKACTRVGFPYERLVYPQLAAGRRSVSTQQAIDLVALADVARHEAVTMRYLLDRDGTDGSFADVRTALAGTMFLDRFERFLATYGHRGRYETDYSLPRLHEHFAPALFAVRGQLQGPPQNMKAVAERQEADAAAAWRAFESRLTPWQKRTMLPRVRAAVRRLKQQYLWREQVRFDLTRVLDVVRRWHLVLAGRFAERGWIDRRDDYFLLLLDEVHGAVESPRGGPGLRGIAAARAAKLAAERELPMPLFMRESELPSLLRRPPSAATNGDHTLTGLCVSPGFAEAEVVVMRDPSEFATMKRGAILVAPATDPSWTPLFTLASGVIVEVGGMLSHASTIAREYGLPALANVRNATRVLRTGDRVTLDASGGVVRRA